MTLKELENKVEALDNTVQQFPKGFRKNSDEIGKVIEMVRQLRKEMDGIKLDIANLKQATFTLKQEAGLKQTYGTTVDTF